MKVAKIHDLLPLKRIHFGPNIFLGILQIWRFLVKTQWKWPKMGNWDPHPKIENFPNLMVLTKNHGLQLMKMTKIYDFWKKKLFWKIWKLDGWPKFIDYNSWNSKIGRKNIKFSQKVFSMLQAHSPCMFVFSSMWEGKKLSHMEAQNSNSYYKSSAKSTDISGSYRAV